LQCEDADGAVAAIAANMMKAVADLVLIERRTGKRLALALEPEPCCFLETTDESLAFFQDVLLQPEAIDLLAAGWSRAAQEIGQVVFRLSWGAQNATLAAASPVSYVHVGAPPFLIIQGTADALVPPAQSTELRDRLLAAGDRATLIEVSHAAHELIPSGGAISPDIATLASRMVAYLLASVG